MLRIRVLEGRLAEKIFDIDQDEVSIGRGATCGIVFPEKVISRLHAKIIKEKGNYFLEDCRSTFGTFVNDKPIKRCELKSGDKIRIGKTIFVFELLADVVAPEERTVVKAIKVDHKKKPDEIRDVRETFYSGSFSLASISAKEGLSVIPVDKIKEKDFELIRNAHQKLSVLYEVNSALHSTLDLDILLKLIMDLLLKIIDFDFGCLMLIDENTGNLIPKVVKTKKKREVDIEKIPISYTIAERAVQNKEAILTSDTQYDTRFKTGESIFAHDIRSAMCAPLWNKEKVVGLIFIDTLGRKQTFSEEDLSFLVALANESAIAIENAKLYRNIQDEIRMRSNLQRFFSPPLVESIISKKERIALGGEKRIASILFTDIRGFTPLTRGMDPQDIVDMLNEHFSVIVRTVFKHGGTLDKFIGDGAMAIFCAPHSYPDFARRAVYSSFEIREGLQELNNKRIAQGKKPVDMGIAISTGEVVTGTIGSEERMEYTAIGECVIQAARLVRIASKDQILITERTYSYVKDIIEAIPLEAMAMKGFKEPIKVYKVVRQR